MLYENDLIFNFLLITLIAKARLVYYDFDFKTRTYSAPTRLSQKLGFFVNNVLALLRLSMAILSAVREYLYPSKKIYHTLVAYVFPGVCLFVFAIHLITNIEHRSYSRYLTSIFHSLPKGRRSVKSMKNLKLMELTLIFFPTLVLTCGPVMTLAGYIIDPEMPISAISWVPKEDWNIGLFLGCLVIDGMSIGILIAAVYNFLVFGIIFVLFMNEGLDAIMKTLRMIENLEGDLLRRLRLMDILASQIKSICTDLQVFNSTSRVIVYLAKQMALVVSTVSLYACVVSFRTYPLVSALAACFALPAVLFFVIFFDQAFWFPEKMNDIKRGYNLQACRIPIPSRRKYHQKWIAGIRFKGIQVGDFQVLERQSTPDFVNFVVSEVTSLLVGNSKV